MKIIQITDLHLDRKGMMPYDIDVRKNFTDMLRAIREEEPDHLVISGDLCFENGEKEIYKWVKNRLELQDFPYSLIAGNHDDPVMMAEVFGLEHLLTDDEIFFAKKIGKTTCLFLDTVKGYHSETQLNWLRRQLHNHKRELIIFMHHPPFKVGLPFMDKKHSHQDSKTITDLLVGYGANLSIFCGHYHIEKTIRYQNLLLQITPSCFYQLDQNSATFRVDHHRIAMRIIETKGEKIMTTVQYLKGNKG